MASRRRKTAAPKTPPKSPPKSPNAGAGAARREPIFRLPPFKIEAVFTIRAQTVDWGVTLLGVPALWKTSRGAGVRVAVLDTGISLIHSDLRDAILEARDFTGSRSGPSDQNSHGTHCAGVVGARDNDSGIIGIAPECGLLIGKVLGDDGSGSSAGIAAGIRWAIDQKADVISMSLGSPSPSRAITQAVSEALAAGIPVVCAAGNEGPALDSIGWPARQPGTISVGAIDRRKEIARFSSRGERVDVVAPGDNILSDIPPNNLGILSGTSMSTPAVTGTIALRIGLKRTLGQKLDTPAELLAVLRGTAEDLGQSGKDHHYGYGLISPEKLLAGVPPVPVAPPPPVMPPAPPVAPPTMPGVPPDVVTLRSLELTANDLTPAGVEKVRAAGVERFLLQA